MIMINHLKKYRISVIGYMTDEEAGTHIITKGGSKYPITAQGWNAFKNEQIPL